MDIHEIRQELKRKPVYEIPLRVAYYARVSSEKDEQLNSLNNQQLYYDDLIGKNKNWTFVKAYVDEGLSAITTKKRENFHHMIADAKAGKFDFIITKEITRFARNTLDSIQYTRELLNHGVAVFFQNDNINTLDEDAELRLTIMAGIAQDEVRKLSSRIKFGHSQAIKNGVVMGNSKIYGYEKEKGKLVIVEKEAEMVRLIFELYATGEYSTPKIENILFEKGYRNFKGERISRNVLRKIIPNPKYKGYYCGNKVKVIDMFTKQQKFLDSDEWIMYRNEEKVPAIVSEEIWEKANRIFSVRSQAIKERRTSYKTGNLFTGKIICAEHGVPFYLKAHKDRKSENNASWVCSHRIKNGRDSCKTFAIKEKELTAILAEVLAELAGDINGIVDKYVQYVKQAYSKTDYEQAMQAIEKEIQRIEQKKERLLEFNLDGKITNGEFAKRNDGYNAEIKAKQKELSMISEEQAKRQSGIGDIFKFKAELLKYSDFSNAELTPAIVDTFIDKIYVTATDGEDGDALSLEICLKAGFRKEKLLGRYGDTVKKMIEAQQKQMAGK